MIGQMEDERLLSEEELDRCLQISRNGCSARMGVKNLFNSAKPNDGEMVLRKDYLPIFRI